MHVYAAEHLLLKQRVAVKILLPEAASSDAVVERFSREAQTAARIQSDHVARVIDAGSLANGVPYLVMEYLEGCDLEELLELQKELPIDEVIDYAIQACEALAHAHAIGIVHRDLKPANLFLACQHGGGNLIKLVDFGISKSTSAKTQKALTGQHVLGSPVYMPPEQLRNAKTIDGRADLWSLGIVVYELLSSTVPFDADGVGEIFAAILQNEPEPLHVRNPKVPRGLSDVIAKCLKKEVSERWQDAAELARALMPYGSGAWNDLVPRIEAIVARARMLKTLPTPIETRIVVGAIAEAAERAKATTGSRSVPPPSQPKPTVVDTNAMSLPPPDFKPRRWPYLLGAASIIGVLVVAFVIKTAGTGSAVPPAEAAPSLSLAAAMPPPPASETSTTTGTEPAPPPTSTSSTKTSPSASASSKKTPPTKPKTKGPRPKFLKTSE